MTTSNRSRSVWETAISRLPRQLFIPDVIYRDLPERDRFDNDYVAVSRATQPELWQELVDADDAVITQVDDGNPSPDNSGLELTSSASQPGVVLEMLEHLDAQPGQRVLEIGTGTGWNATLLASVLGADHVTTVEIDPALAARARDTLAARGHGQVTVITGEGLDGWPPHSPYDRVIATCSVHTVPWAWITQTKIGGRLVVPVTNTYFPLGLVVLTRTTDGAAGKVVAPASFMSARAQRRPRRQSMNYDAPVKVSRTNLHPYWWAGEPHAATAIGQRVNGITVTWDATGPGTGTALLRAYRDHSWATVEVGDTQPFTVEQAGPRRLYSEIRSAYRWWLAQAEPELTDWHVTITPSGQNVALPTARDLPAAIVPAQASA